MKIGIVVSEMYWEEITSKMAAFAESACEGLGVESRTVRVPGSFDIPLAAKKLLDDGCAGVVTLGAIIEGQTKHDETIANALAYALQRLALEYSKPVVLGVNGPRMTRGQAVARIDRAREVTEACVRLAR